MRSLFRFSACNCANAPNSYLTFASQFNFPKESLFRVGVVPKLKQILFYISRYVFQNPRLYAEFFKKDFKECLANEETDPKSKVNKKWDKNC